MFNLHGLSNLEKDIEILILPHHLENLEREQTRPIRPSKAEKLTPAMLTERLKNHEQPFYQPTSQ
jgi:hypothetical protein